MTKGMATSHSHKYFKGNIVSNEIYVWPDSNGSDYGQAIEPLYSNQVKAAKEDSRLYEILAMLDVIRVGKNREKKVAINYLRKLLLNESSNEYNKN